MQTLTLPAYFDGEQIRLDIPIKLAPNTRLIVTVLPSEEEQDMELLSLWGLSGAYGDDEPEYTMDMIKEPNPDYAGS